MPGVTAKGAEDATSGWDILGTRLKTQFSNNIRNNFGFLNNAAPEGIGAVDKLFTQEGRKVFRERIYVLGAGDYARSIVDTIRSRPDLGMEVVDWQDVHMEPAERKKIWIERREKQGSGNVTIH